MHHELIEVHLFTSFKGKWPLKGIDGLVATVVATVEVITNFRYISFLEPDIR